MTVPSPTHSEGDTMGVPVICPLSREGVGLSSDGINLRCQHAHRGAEVDSNSPVVIHPCTQPILINNSLHDVH
jgi:hypothetical protein